MNKFIKFPLVLAIVGVICAGSLSVVYEITSERINRNKNAEAFELLGGIVEDMTGVETVTDKYNAAKVEDANIQTIYEVSNASGVTAYGYLAEVTGYNPGINFLLVLSSNKDESKIIGFDVVSHSETNSGTYGGPLLNSPDFSAQFTDLSFDDVSSGVDFVAGSTAKVTLNAVKTGVYDIIDFHKSEIFGEESTGAKIELTPDEMAAVNLAEGYTMVDKSEDFKANLKANTSANKYESILEELQLLNYVDITDASGAVKGHAYIVEGEYNCEVEHGNRAWQSYKFVFMFDENGANTQLIIVSSGDSLGAIGQPSIGDQAWVAENFNGKTITEIGDALANDEIDYIHGATFTSNAIKAHVSSVVDAHSRAYGK